MGRILQEAKLADRVLIQIIRERTEAGGLAFRLNVDASTLDATTGEVIRSYSRDIWDQLTATQQTNLTNIATAIIDRLAMALGVAAS
jgi:hypothetical protein